MDNQPEKRPALRRYLPLVFALLAILITLPSLNMGLRDEDLLHRAWLLDSSRLDRDTRESGWIEGETGGLSGAMMNLFSFMGERTNVKKLMDSGALPWWTYDELRLSFWRPVSAITYWIDYRLYPESPALMHAHSLLWFAVAVFLVSLLYGRFMSPLWAVGVAALLYTLDENYYAPVSWLANRNALISLSFAVGSLIAHDRWRRGGSIPSALASSLLLILALLSAEAAVTIVGYTASYALFVDRGARVPRFASILPSVVITVAWRLAYSALGYGTIGSGLYIDPAREPVRYLSAVVERVPIFFLGQWGWQEPAVFNHLSESAKTDTWLLAVAFLTALLLIFAPLLRKDPVARFWGAGMLLSMILACAGVLAGRVLLFAGLGAMGLFAQLLRGLISRAAWVPEHRAYGAAAWTACALILVLNLALPLTAAAGRILTAGSPPLPWAPLESRLPSTARLGSDEQDLVIVAGRTGYVLPFYRFQRARQSAPVPPHVRLLAPAFNPIEVTRTGDRSLALRAVTGTLLAPADVDQAVRRHPVYGHQYTNDAFRAPGRPFEPGTRLALPGLEIEVVSVSEDGFPVEVHFRFAVPLEDPSLAWLTWDWRRNTYVPFTPPPTGRSLLIPGPF